MSSSARIADSGGTVLLAVGRGKAVLSFSTNFCFLTVLFLRSSLDFALIEEKGIALRNYRIDVDRKGESYVKKESNPGRRSGLISFWSIVCFL